MSAGAPSVSVIIPMYNAEKMIERCLAPLLSMLGAGEIVEIIVVDDGSTDGSAAIVRAHAALQLLAMEGQGGPGAARNRAAQIARGEYLWFIDSDVIVADNAARVLRETLSRIRPAAVIGLYDDRPGATNFLSQYKNLVHHYYHYRGKDQSSTFWAGCGAAQRSLFLQLGGFDARRYRYPSIEDIELGLSHRGRWRRHRSRAPSAGKAFEGMALCKSCAYGSVPPRVAVVAPDAGA